MSNNKNNNDNSEKKNWKMYASLALYAVLGLALGYAIAKGVLYVMNKPKVVESKIENKISDEKLSTFQGYVSANFEGENKLEISFDHDSSFTVTQGKESRSRYFTITSASTTIATIYISYEGGRGYTATDYINNTLKKFIANLEVNPRSASSSSRLYSANSLNSEWSILPSEDGAWLAIVENTKVNSDNVKVILETLVLK